MPRNPTTTTTTEAVQVRHVVCHTLCTRIKVSTYLIWCVDPLEDRHLGHRKVYGSHSLFLCELESESLNLRLPSSHDLSQPVR